MKPWKLFLHTTLHHTMHANTNKQYGATQQWLVVFPLSTLDIVPVDWYEIQSTGSHVHPKTDLNLGYVAESHLQVFNVPLLIPAQGNPPLNPDMLCLWRLLTDTVYSVGHMATWFEFLHFFFFLKRCKMVWTDLKFKLRLNYLPILALVLPQFFIYTKWVATREL